MLVNKLSGNIILRARLTSRTKTTSDTLEQMGSRTRRFRVMNLLTASESVANWLAASCSGGGRRELESERERERSEPNQQVVEESLFRWAAFA